MGDIADMMIEGFLDSETGEFLDGDSPGYPRTRNRNRLHTIKRVVCPVCQKRFGNKRNLKQHTDAKHGVKSE